MSAMVANGVAEPKTLVMHLVPRDDGEFFMIKATEELPSPIAHAVRSLVGQLELTEDRVTTYGVIGSYIVVETFGHSNDQYVFFDVA